LNASNNIQSQTTNSSQNNSSFIANTSDLLIPSETFLNSISKEGALFLRNTMHHFNEVVDTDDGTYMNEIISPNICIFCDRYIIGVAKLNWISKEQIIKHSNRMSVDKWKELTGNTAMNPILREQYKVNDSEFEHLLLSPRSRKNGYNHYLCCSTCYSSFRDDRINAAPPKYLFANNFALGILPDNA